ncbi:NAD(P)-binding protein [Tilletiopsis washingtonensis]|uniref:NAD(P)-binding protein n=1 Tax=Tilletiopsis washingtonensis TaxID=58919 RepID=A0A316Z365_9BASI|nr:NAD(P)-binding protein [Tilletiopsis washingtonensis]PWN96237.1 NAD(P)-binding protein [Tilletiopsis washingtonensis]
MPLSVDTLVSLVRLTVAHPASLLAFLAYRYQQNAGSIPRDGLVTTAYVCLALYASSWLNNRLRNGLLPLARLNAKTWPQELVFVTGGAAGIGKLTAERLAHKGAKVAAVDVVDFKPEHANIKTYKCDISDIEALQAVREQIVKDFGLQVTMVANIAGINNQKLILDLTARDVDRMLNVNLKSHFWTAQVFLPAMVKRKRGHFLSVSSTMGLVGICHQSDYVAAKHGILGMHESLHYELQKMYKTPHVRTSTVVIGHTRTALFNTFDVGVVGRFLSPLLEPSAVADRIVAQFERQDGGMILMPFTNELLPGIKGFPYWLRNVLQATSGADGAYTSRPSREQLGE